MRAIIEAPCGCELKLESNGVLHLFPCCPECPEQYRIRDAVAARFHGPIVDVRAEEEITGKQISGDEILSLLAERN